MSSNRVNEIMAFETIESIINVQFESMTIYNIFNIKSNCQHPYKIDDNFLNEIVFIHAYNHCLETGLLNGMDDTDLCISFMEILTKLLNQKDIIISCKSISNEAIFFSSCARFLAYLQKDSISTTDGQLLESLQKLLGTSANLSIAIPPPIIPELMNITENNLKCNVYYGRLISDFILKMENKENMSEDERISKNNELVTIICQYHHYNLSFWTIYPSKILTSAADHDSEDSSEFDIIDIPSNKAPDSTEFDPVSISDNGEESTDAESYSDIGIKQSGISLYQDIINEYPIPPLDLNSAPSNLNELMLNCGDNRDDKVHIMVSKEEQFELDSTNDHEFIIEEPIYHSPIFTNCKDEWIITPKESDRNNEDDTHRSRNNSLSISASTPITRSPRSHCSGHSIFNPHSFSNSGESLLLSPPSKFKVMIPKSSNDYPNKLDLNAISPPPNPLSPTSNVYQSINVHKMYPVNPQISNELTVAFGRTKYSSGSNNNNHQNNRGGRRDRNRDNNNHHTKNGSNNDENEEEKKSAPKQQANPKLNANAKEFTPKSSNNSLGTIDENQTIPSSINSPRDDKGIFGKKDTVLVPRNNDMCPSNPDPSNDFEQKNNYQSELNITRRNAKSAKSPRDVEQKMNYDHSTNKESKRKKSYRSPNQSHINHTYSYKPNKDIRIKSTIHVDKAFISCQTIPSRIKENIPNFYDLIDIYTAIHPQTTYAFNGGKVRIFNYDIHDKTTDESLFVVAESQNPRNGYSWYMVCKLFTKQDIIDKYGIYQLPKSPRDHCQYALMKTDSEQEQIKSIITKSNGPFCQNTNKKWNKIQIHNNPNSEERMTLSMTTPKFKAAIRGYIESQNGKIELIPIIMFYDKKSNQTYDEDTYRLCWIQIVQIREYVSIGISYIYNRHKQCIEINGIHLNKNKIQQQHKWHSFLTKPEHTQNCKCLDSFVSILDVLHIGNPDDDKNKLKSLRKEIEKLKQSHSSTSQLSQQQSIHCKSNVSDDAGNAVSSMSSDAINK